MIPGEIDPIAGEIELNAGQPTVTLSVANTGDRPIQVGSHYHFAETNPALDFDRAGARGMRLNIAAGTAVRFEPGQSRAVELVDYAGARVVYGFNAKVMGALDRPKRGAAKTQPAGAKPAARRPSAVKTRAAKPATRKTGVSK